jgi:hypothetical protein
MLSLFPAAPVWPCAPPSATVINVKALRDRSEQVTAVVCSQLLTASQDMHHGARIPVAAAANTLLQP